VVRRKKSSQEKGTEQMKNKEISEALDRFVKKELAEMWETRVMPDYIIPASNAEPSRIEPPTCDKIKGIRSLTHSFSLWRLKRMMLRACKLDNKIDRLASEIEARENTPK